jgi:hypothetical protein
MIVRESRRFQQLLRLTRGSKNAFEKVGNIQAQVRGRS